MDKNILIYVIGNPLLDFDSLPLRLLPELEKEFKSIDFQPLDPNENIKPINKELTMIDTAEGIEEPTLIKDLSGIEAGRIYSAHDFDLAFNLKLLYKLGKLKKIRIFGIPPHIKKQAALCGLASLFKKEFFNL